MQCYAISNKLGQYNLTGQFDEVRCRTMDAILCLNPERHVIALSLQDKL